MWSNMLVFLGLVVTAAVKSSAEEYQHDGLTGLYFDHNGEYAPKYDNYQPHNYHFDYAVSDPHTGDHKSQWEVKDKGVVRGGYSLLEPDGTTRIVEYIADDNGFRAIVKKLDESLHPEPHVEAHGFHSGAEDHVDALVEPQIAPFNAEPVFEVATSAQAQINVPIQEVPRSYHTYNGQADNYARDVLNYPVEQNLPSVPHHKQESIENRNVVPIQYYVDGPKLFNPVESEHLVLQAPLVSDRPESYHHPQSFFTPRVPHGSQGHVVSLEQINTFSNPDTFSRQQAESGNLIRQPQALGVEQLSHSNSAEVPHHQGQQFYQGVVSHEPLLSDENLQDDDGVRTNFDAASYDQQNHGYYQGEYSQKIQRAVSAPPPSKSLVHIEDDQSTVQNVGSFIINAGSR